MINKTDEFNYNGDSIQAEIIASEIEVTLHLNFGAEYGYMEITKQQTAEFARQLLEMAGEEGNEND